MAGLRFGGTGENAVKGSATSNKVDQYKIKDGDNTIRLFGPILPRYVYWLDGTNGKKLPVECLEFNRETEEFDKAEKDWMKVHYPDAKCGWAYCNLCIDEGKVKVFNFKKKLFEQIMMAAEDLGDPSDPETGWDIKFRKAKTGPLPINVEYTLQVLKCKPRPLTDEERAIVDASKPIDEIIPRKTPAEQKELIEKIKFGGGAENDDSVDENVSDEFKVD